MKTTLEMDGLFTQEDIDNANKAWFQCRDCTKWTLLRVDDKNSSKACQNCSGGKLDPTSATSMRTFNPLNKRKVK